MTSAEIITIGTEILLGEIQDTNTAFIARQLMTSGIDLFRTHTIGDNPSRIAQTIQDSLKRADIIITTGGLGPTVDDPTREAVSLAINKPLVFSSELWDEICAYFNRIGRIPSENNKRQAYLPETAQPIHNPIGTAPGFYIKAGNSYIFSVPGVPKETEYLMVHFILPFLSRVSPNPQVIRSRTIHVAGMGESQLDMIIGDFEKLSNPTVGLLAKPGQVDIRVAVKADTIDSADKLISGTINELNTLLKHNVYGYDDELLIDGLAKVFPSAKYVTLIESGFNGNISSSFYKHPELLSITEQIDVATSLEALEEKMLQCSEDHNNHLIFGCLYTQKDGISMLDCNILEQGKMSRNNRKFGGPPENGIQWAINLSLDILRRYFISYESEKEN
jgi:competence/damage-inducible protein CinA-like protein